MLGLPLEREIIVAPHDPGDFVCMIDPGNAPSTRLAEKFGYRRYADAAYKGAPTVLFRRPAPGGDQTAT